ncbi:hypothetical protein D3C83_223400 [compost metagenome]
MQRTWAILLFSLIIGLAVITNQYLRRRVGFSIGLLVFGAVGLAVIGSLWGYFYLYHA